MEVCRIDRELHGCLGAPARRILERDQGCVQDAILRGAFGIAQALAFVGGEGGDIDQADDIPGFGGGVGDVLLSDQRRDLKPARTSSEKSCGCSQAAKWPPLSSLL